MRWRRTRTDSHSAGTYRDGRTLCGNALTPESRQQTRDEAHPPPVLAPKCDRRAVLQLREYHLRMLSRCQCVGRCVQHSASFVKSYSSAPRCAQCRCAIAAQGTQSCSRSDTEKPTADVRQRRCEGREISHANPGRRRLERHLAVQSVGR
ncbi:hypothetical protein GY45DRAFT_601704 [Cubamyces sp. BRFM 1775]|nr:hypothetical protein GY45DRAFT_601704 [Cubamyces sp. BRFM 1775]